MKYKTIFLIFNLNNFWDREKLDKLVKNSFEIIIVYYRYFVVIEAAGFIFPNCYGRIEETEDENLLRKINEALRKKWWVEKKKKEGEKKSNAFFSYSDWTSSFKRTRKMRASITR